MELSGSMFILSIAFRANLLNMQVKRCFCLSTSLSASAWNLRVIAVCCYSSCGDTERPQGFHGAGQRFPKSLQSKYKMRQSRRSFIIPRSLNSAVDQVQWRCTPILELYFAAHQWDIWAPSMSNQKQSPDWTSWCLWHISVSG